MVMSAKGIISHIRSQGQGEKVGIGGYPPSVSLQPYGEGAADNPLGPETDPNNQGEPAKPEAPSKIQRLRQVVGEAAAAYSRHFTR